MNVKLIKSEQDYKKALKRIEELWEAVPNTEKGDELQVLAVLVEYYEKEKYDILPPDPVEAIKFRMDQMGLRKTDLAVYLGGRNRSTEVLNKNRDLSVRMMRVLHTKMKIPAESLLAKSKTVRKAPRRHV